MVCRTCMGSGKRRYGYVHIRYYPCKTCKGTGKVTAQRLKRIEGAKKAKITREENLKAKKDEFQKEFPDVHKEICLSRAAIEGTSTFLNSLRTQFEERGTLSEKQIQAVRNGIARRLDKQVEQQASQAVRGETVVQAAEGAALVAAMQQAGSSGLKHVRLLTEVASFSLAPATGRNPGFVYIKDPTEQYAGKIAPDGKFFPTRDCSDEFLGQLKLIMSNPLEAAKIYGKRTGKCSCCGRELTDPTSIANGIGPICQSRFF